MVFSYTGSFVASHKFCDFARVSRYILYQQLMLQKSHRSPTEPCTGQNGRRTQKFLGRDGGNAELHRPRRRHRNGSEVNIIGSDVPLRRQLSPPKIYEGRLTASRRTVETHGSVDPRLDFTTFARQDSVRAYRCNNELSLSHQRTHPPYLQSFVFIVGTASNHVIAKPLLTFLAPSDLV